MEIRLKKETEREHTFEKYYWAISDIEQIAITFDDYGKMIRLDYDNNVGGFSEDEQEVFSKMNTWEEFLDFLGFDSKDFLFFRGKEIKIIIEEV